MNLLNNILTIKFTETHEKKFTWAMHGQCMFFVYKQKSYMENAWIMYEPCMAKWYFFTGNLKSCYSKIKFFSEQATMANSSAGDTVISMTSETNEVASLGNKGLARNLFRTESKPGTRKRPLFEFSLRKAEIPRKTLRQDEDKKKRILGTNKILFQV